MTTAQWCFLAVLACIWLGSMVAVAVMARRAPVDPPWGFDSAFFDSAADEAVALTREGER